MSRHMTMSAARVAAAVMVAGLAFSAVTVPAALSAATKPAATKPAATKSAASKSATPAASAATTIPLAPKGQIEVQAWPTSTESFLVVSLTLPTTAQLPARVRIPLPDGATVTWAGEIMGSDAASDIQRTYDVVTTGGGRAIEFVAQESRDLRYEADLPAPAVSGARVMTTLKWVQTTDALSVDPAVKTPAGATNVQIKPAPSGQPRTNSAGEALYTLPQQGTAIGSGFTLEVAFQEGAVGSTAPASTSPSGTSPLLYIVLGILLLVVVVVVLLALRSGLGSGPTDEDEDGG
jgi:hypothetical protein